MRVAECDHPLGFICYHPRSETAQALAPGVIHYPVVRDLEFAVIAPCRIRPSFPSTSGSVATTAEVALATNMQRDARAAGLGVLNLRRLGPRLLLLRLRQPQVLVDKPIELSVCYCTPVKI